MERKLYKSMSDKQQRLK